MIKKGIGLLLILLIIFTTVGDRAFATTEVKVTSLKINNGRSLSLEVGDTVTLPVSYSPSNATNTDLTFESSDPKVAKVDANGTVTAVKSGSCKITAKMGGKTTSISVSVYVNKTLKASFEEKDLKENRVKEITINVSSSYESDTTSTKDESATNNNNSSEEEIYIFLPSGYMVTGTTATFPADKNGYYPFTVYDGSGLKKTFYYEVKGISNNRFITESTEETTDFDINLLYNNLILQYDYEKKQCLLNAPLDKIRNVTIDGSKSYQTNEINHYIGNIKSGEELTIDISVEGAALRAKLLKQGEFYLLTVIQSVNNSSNNLYYTYKAYNFTLPYSLTTEPEEDFITNNGNYQVVAKSKYGQREIFCFSVTNIDYTRPDTTISLTYEDLIELTAVDNRQLDYIITYDGKFIDVPENYEYNSEYLYKDTTKFEYNGDYYFIVADASGNRTIAKANVDGKKYAPYVRNFSLKVHNSNYANFIFKDLGDIYYVSPTTDLFYNNTFPSYMKGMSSTVFSPNGTITRAQMITMLCRLTDLPYDINLASKNKFTDIDNHWAFNYICMGSSKKYIQGYKDKTFKPDNTLNRADFCIMLNNISVLKSKITAIPAVYNYDLSDIDGQYVYAKPEVLKIANRGLLSVNGDKFNPGAPVTRAEVVRCLNILYDLTPSAEEMNYIEGLYNKYYSFNDIKNHPLYKDLLISIVGMYREEKLK